MDNYKEQMRRTSEEVYIEGTYTWNGGITQFEIPCQRDSMPHFIKDSKLVEAVKE